jgi:tripartite-type tricarboxylate transporter receptor subunit TctC
MLKWLLSIAAAAAIAAGPMTAQAQDYPDTSKTIRLIIPNSAGGGTDIAGRLLAEGLEEKLGTTVVVENLSGAGGIEGATALMNAEPDGYTLALIPIPQVSMYYLDPERGGDFKREAATVVAQHDYGPLAIAVAADSPYQTLADVVNAVKENPGSLTSASSSVLGTGHLSLLRLNKVAEIDLNWTAMEQQGTALASLLGGHIDVITDTFSELYPHAQGGEIRILAVFDDQRAAQMPDVPTAKEQGFDVVLTTTRLLIAPAGTPEAIVSKLETAVEELIADPAYQAKAKERQVGIAFKNSEEAAQVWENIDTNFGPIVTEFRSQ